MEALNNPEPELMVHIFKWFLELKSHSSTPMISVTDVYCWSRLTGTYISPNEVKLIFLINQLYLEFKNGN